MESGYESSMSTPPNSVQMRNTNITSPVFHQEAIPEQLPTQTSKGTYFNQKPQINFAQDSHWLQNPFQSPGQQQPTSANLTFNPTTNLLDGSIKQESFTMHQCAGSKRNHHSVQQPTVNNPSQDFSRNPNPILGVDMLMSSFDDSIPPIAPLKELKTEDLDILEIPAVPPQIAPQMQQSTQWPQNVQYVFNSEQSSIPKNNLMCGNMKGNFLFNPLQQQQQQQFRNGLQPQFPYNTNQ